MVSNPSSIPRLTVLSKSWDNLFTFYTALSYENVNIESTYKYYLPVVVQWQLGMLEQDSTKPTPGYPGDQNPQTAQIKVQDSQMRFTFGLSKEISNIILSLDGSFTKMFMLGFSLGYKF